MHARHALTKEEPFQSIRLFRLIQHPNCISTLLLVRPLLSFRSCPTSYLCFLCSMRPPSLVKRLNRDEAENTADQSQRKSDANNHGKLLHYPVSKGSIFFLFFCWEANKVLSTSKFTICIVLQTTL